MPFCENCGTQVAEQNSFCPSCGHAVYVKAQNVEKEVPTNSYSDSNNSNSYDNQDIENNKYLCILAYLSILFFVPLLAAPNSKFARFHANQGLVLFLLEVASQIVSHMPIIGWVISPALYVFSIVCVILGIVNVCKGEAKKLPIIGEITIIK